MAELRRFLHHVGDLPLAEITREDVRSFRDHRGETLRASTLNIKVTLFSDRDGFRELPPQEVRHNGQAGRPALPPTHREATTSGGRSPGFPDIRFPRSCGARGDPRNLWRSCHGGSDGQVGRAAALGRSPESQPESGKQSLAVSRLRHVTDNQRTRESNSRPLQ
jgi:hypothetical protein